LGQDKIGQISRISGARVQEQYVQSSNSVQIPYLAALRQERWARFGF